MLRKFVLLSILGMVTGLGLIANESEQTELQEPQKNSRISIILTANDATDVETQEQPVQLSANDDADVEEGCGTCGKPSPKHV